MPVSQLSKGVFIVSPDKVEVFKDTSAGGYVSAFTKARADQWELSLKESASKIQNAEARFKYQMDAYQERLADLERRRAQAAIDIDKFNTDAVNAAREFNAKSEAERIETNAKLNQQRQELMSKITYVDPGGTRTSTRTTVGGGGTAADKAAEYKVSTDETKVLTDAVAGKTVPAAIADFKSKSEMLLSGATPERAMAIRKGIVDELIKDAALSQKKSIGDEELKISVLDQVNDVDPGLVEDYLNVDDAIKRGGSAGRTVTTATEVAGKVGRPAYGKIAQVQIAPSDQIQAEKINKEAALAAYDAAIKGLARPDLPETDLVYGARRLMQRNFGPTRGPAESAFDQRRALDALLRATPEQQAGLIERFRRSRTPVETTPVSGEVTSVASTPAAPVTPPTAPSTARGASPEETVETPAVAPKENTQLRALLDRIAADQSKEPRYGLAESLSRSRSAAQSPSVSESVQMIAEEPKGELTSLPPSGISDDVNRARLAEIDAQIAAFRQGQAERTIDEGFVYPSTSSPNLISRSLAPNPPTKAREGIEPKGPMSSLPPGGIRPQSPVEGAMKLAAEMKLANPFVLKDEPSISEAARNIAPGTKPTTPAETAKEQQLTYTKLRYENGKKLAGEERKLKRLLRSSIGTTVQKIWKSNPGDLRKSFDEITLLYSGKGNASRSQAHEILIALELTAKKSTDIPKEGE